MAKINWTDEARAWLREIHQYIAQDNRRAATGVVAGIYQRVRVLVNFPRIGHVYRMEPDGEIRILLYGHYSIAYLLKEGDHVDILAVFHGALEMDKYLG